MSRAHQPVTRTLTEVLVVSKGKNTRQHGNKNTKEHKSYTSPMPPLNTRRKSPEITDSDIEKIDHRTPLTINRFLSL